MASGLAKHGFQFSKYALVGLAVNGSLYLLFIGLLWIGIDPVIAAGLGYIVGVAASYWMNKVWSFGSQQTNRHDLPRYLVAYGIGLVAAMGTIKILTAYMRPEFAQLINICTTACVIYLALVVLKFGGKENADEPVS